MLHGVPKASRFGCGAGMAPLSPGVSINRHVPHPPHDAPSMRFGIRRIKHPGFIDNLIRDITFYSPIVQAVLVCSFSKTLNVIRRWETKAIFQPHKHTSVKDISSPMLKEKLIECNFDSEPGVRLNAWYFPAKPGMDTLVLAHGNKGNLNNYEEIMEAFIKRGYGVFAFDYRHYGNSKSKLKLSQNGVFRDFEAASQYLASQFPNPALRVPYSRQIPTGVSLGGAVVLGALGQQTQKSPSQVPPYKAVLVMSSFTSISDVFNHMIGKVKIKLPFRKTPFRIPPHWFPMEQRFTQRFESLQAIQHLRLPLFLLHGLKDGDVPHQMADQLEKAAVNVPLLEKYKVPNGRHSDLFVGDSEAIFTRLNAFLGRIQPYRNGVATPDGRHNLDPANVLAVTGKQERIPTE